MIVTLFEINMIDKATLNSILKTLEHLTYTYEDEMSIQSFQLGIDAIKTLREFLKEQ